MTSVLTQKSPIVQIKNDQAMLNVQRNDKIQSSNGNVFSLNNKNQIQSTQDIKKGSPSVQSNNQNQQQQVLNESYADETKTPNNNEFEQEQNLNKQLLSNQNNPNNLQPTQRNYKLITVYAISCLLSIIGFIFTIVLLKRAASVFGDKWKDFVFDESLSPKFNFIFIYSPYSCLVVLACIYLIFQSYQGDGRQINHSQTLTLFISCLAFIFGTINFAQFKSQPQINCNGLPDNICDLSKTKNSYQQMVIPVSLIPFLLIAAAQYILRRLKQSLLLPPAQNYIQRDVELQIAQQQPNYMIKSPEKNIKGYPQNGNFPNGVISDKLNAGNAQQNYLNQRPSVLQTDQKFKLDQKIDKKKFNIDPQITLNGNQANQYQFDIQNPVQMYTNQVPNGRNGSVLNNFGMPMYQNKSNQITLDKEVLTPKNLAQQDIGNQRASVMNNYSTPTPNQGWFSGYQLNNNQNIFDVNYIQQDMNQIKTTNNQFTNTQIKSPKKSLSPIDRAALQNNMAQNTEKINEYVQNADYNPFGTTEKGEIQIGKHPYILGAKDPKVGKMLDQVQIMVNNQVQSLIVDLKKQNKY